MVRRETIVGWLFVLPALLTYTVFVLLPFLLTIQYSFFRWNGVGPATWVGLKNYLTIFQVPDLLGSIPEITDPTPPLSGIMDGAKSALDGLSSVSSSSERRPTSRRSRTTSRAAFTADSPE